MEKKKAVATARYAGYTRLNKKWQEDDARSKAYCEQRAAAREARAAERAAKEEEAKKRRIKAAARKKANKYPRRIWDNFIIIADVRKSDNMKLRIAACTRDGYRCVAIRQFTYWENREKWVPTREGVTIPLTSALDVKKSRHDQAGVPTLIHPMAEFLEVLDAAIKTASTMDLEDPANAIWLLPKTKQTEENSNNENQRSES